MMHEHSAPRWRVVRRRGKSLAEDAALADLPEELRAAMVTYVLAQRAEYAARSAVSDHLTRHGMRWHQVEAISRKLAFGELPGDGSPGDDVDECTHLLQDLLRAHARR
jgi:hypothetical protein